MLRTVTRFSAALLLAAALGLALTAAWLFSRGTATLPAAQATPAAVAQTTTEDGRVFVSLMGSEQQLVDPLPLGEGAALALLA